MQTLAPRAPDRTASNRRLYPRRRGHFPATYYIEPGSPLPAYGLDISGGGLCLLTRDPVPEPRLPGLSIVGMIDGRRVHFEASGRWGEPVRSRGSVKYRYGLRLRSISDADWNFVMAHSTDASAGVPIGKVLTTAQRDAMLPHEKQHRIAAVLERGKRIDPQTGKQLPLIEYRFEGYEMRAGVAYYRLQIRSRRATPDGPQDLHTPVLAGIETDAVKVLIEE